MEAPNLRGTFEGKTVLITGGAGSIGSHLAMKLGKYGVKEIRVFDVDENGLFNLKHKMNHMLPVINFRVILGDVRDFSRVTDAMPGVSIVIHAAALKHVETCELAPIEAVHVNVLGTANLVNASMSAGVERFLTIGSDKAVYPIGSYGATKRLAELVTIQAQKSPRNKGTFFSVARFGNVVGTRGSVTELWGVQKDAGEAITVTDERMSRFFWSIEEATNFILLTTAMIGRGVIFIPNMKEEKIIDLAKKFSDNIKLIGVLPGETIGHLLLSNEEREKAIEVDAGGNELFKELKMWVIQS